ncbi:MAG: ABC transporter substrate-binding protein [Chloroflexi bacterium]|nr:ABC transporter substrate-binding protein [Chloroflexota bacterium]
MKDLMRVSIALLGLFASACAASSPAAPVKSAEAPVEVSIVMGYIPHVQFAPWYVAEKKGYLAAAGVKMKYNYGFEVDGIKLVGAGQADFALLGGDQVIQARAQNAPLVYVANWYNAFPIAIFSLKEKNIKTPNDLIGKRVGLPGFFGATYTGWRALLFETGIKEEQIKAQDVGFNQIAALTQGTIDAAAGYSNNEPVVLKLAGKDLNVIQVSDYSKLVGIGLVTNEKTANDKSQLVQRVVAAFLRGVQDTITNPDEALNITIAALPEAGGENLSSSKAVLNASVALWRSPRLGYVDPADWAASVKFMKEAGFIKADIDLNKSSTNKFVP